MLPGFNFQSSERRLNSQADLNTSFFHRLLLWTKTHMIKQTLTLEQQRQLLIEAKEKLSQIFDSTQEYWYYPYGKDVIRAMGYIVESISENVEINKKGFPEYKKVCDRRHRLMYESEITPKFMSELNATSGEQEVK